MDSLNHGQDGCHCIPTDELEKRYTVLRREEHARTGKHCGTEWSREVAKYPENAERNRYTNILPWDHSRVLLPVKEGHSDYINASWIQLGPMVYIATQGPLSNTILHFWHLVYTYGGDPAVIIMLTALYENSVEKCAQYWPDRKDTPLVLPAKDGLPFGVTVYLEKNNRNDHYHYSMFRVVPDDPAFPPKPVHHLYYHSWLDYSRPNADADIIALIKFINNGLRSPSSPPIVHCSAGIGRTGTFIAIDSLISYVDPEIQPSLFPEISPVWRMDQKVLQYASKPFTKRFEEQVINDAGSDQQSGDGLEIQNETWNAGINSNAVSPSSMQPITLSTGPNSETNSLRSGTQLTTKPAVGGDSQSESPDGSFVSVKDDVASVNPPEAGESATGDQSGNNTGYSIEAEDHGVLSSAVSSMLSTESVSKPASDGSAKTGPVIDKKAPWMSPSQSPSQSPMSVGSSMMGRKMGLATIGKCADVGQDVLNERPSTVDVLAWFDDEDPVMSTVRCLRKQRPKMVQGGQQMGYIYDQLAIVQQFMKNCDGQLKRQSSFSDLSEADPSKDKFRPGNISRPSTFSVADSGKHRSRLHRILPSRSKVNFLDLSTRSQR